MVFHEVRFPDDISRGARGGPERRTQIVELASGDEERNASWANSRRRYDVAYGIRRADDLAAVVAFFEARNGRLHGFRFKDCMVMDASSGLPRVDFGLFDLVVPCPASSQSCSSMHSIESTVCEAPDCTAPIAASAITGALGQVSKSTPPAKDSAESAVRGIPATTCRAPCDCWRVKDREGVGCCCCRR